MTGVFCYEKTGINLLEHMEGLADATFGGFIDSVAHTGTGEGDASGPVGVQASYSAVVARRAADLCIGGLGGQQGYVMAETQMCDVRGADRSVC